MCVRVCVHLCVTCACVGNSKINHYSSKSFTLNPRPQKPHAFLSQKPHAPLAVQRGLFFSFRIGVGAILQLSSFRVASALCDRQPSLLTPAPHPRVFRLIFVSLDLLQTWKQKESHDSYKLPFLFFNMSTNLNKIQIQLFSWR